MDLSPLRSKGKDPYNKMGERCAGVMPVHRAARESARGSIQMEFTCGIDDEAIELEAMNRLHDGSIKLHLTNCDRCQGRVSEYRNWIIAVKLALQELREEQRETPSDNSYGSSPESGA